MVNVLTFSKLLQVQTNKEAASADAKRQEAQKLQQAPGAARTDNEAADRRTSDEEQQSAASEWPDFRSSGSSYAAPQQQQQQKPAGGKSYSVASTHDYMGYGSNRQPQSKGYQQELWDDDKEGDLW